MLGDYINKKYLNNVSAIHKSFSFANPFPCLVLNDFLDNKFAKLILKELMKEKFSHQECDLFSFSQCNDLALSNNFILKKFYDFFNSDEFKDFIFSITNIKCSAKIDASGFIYRSADYLLPHDDRLESRKIAYVLNLSNNFSKKDGGSLDFFNKNKVIKSFIPSFNTLILFKVIENKTFHQVSEVLTDKKDRISIAGWFNDK